MDMIDFCQRFFASTFMPISYYHWPEHFIWSCPSAFQKMEYHSRVLADKIKFYKNPDYFITDSYAYFGMVNIDDSPSKMDYLILGPLFSTPCSDETVHNFLHEGQLSGEAAEEMTQVLLNTPRVSFHQFLSMLSFLHLCINRKEINIAEHFDTRIGAMIQEDISKRYSNLMYDKREYLDFHNTFDLELQLIDCIKTGDAKKIKPLLLSYPAENQITGQLSNNPIRNRRNLFIVTTTLAARAAIAGGLDTEQAYQLSDLYIQECERTLRIEIMDTLSYTMLIDFATRVARQKLPIQGMSKEVFDCVQFISQRPNEPLRVDDVADFIGKSRSYITRRFKEELGFDISSFIMRCKLEEAKSLLTYTDKPLSEISSYLCFSSQAYFQNVFKKKYGITPLQYRTDSASAKE